MISLLFLLGDVLKQGFVGIILTLDTLIYGLIGSAFRVFMAIASARLLSSEAYYAVANKVYLVIGVLMLFVLSYGILKAIVNPDKEGKTMGPDLLKKISIAVIGLAVTPALFNLMYQAQGLVLEHDVLAKIFFRSENTDKINTGGLLTVGGTTVPVDDNINPDDYVKIVGGSYTATTIWQAFFYPAPDSGLTAADITADPSDYYLKAAGWGLACGGVIGGTIAGVAYFAAANIYNPIGWILGIGAAAAVATCTLAGQNYDAAETGTAITDDEISLEQAYALTAAGESFGLYTIFLDNYLDDGEISYLFGISTLCGAFALYAFASFSIDMGIRAAKLAYFQVIAPIPLVMQMLPGKDGVFKDYTKKVIHTFLEVFIRITVVYIVIYLICHIQDLFSSADALWANSDLSTPELMFAIAFLIIGLIIFCKDAPKFFGETLGINSGNLSLGMKKKLADGGVFNAVGIGAGGLRAATSNWRNYKPPKGRKGSLLARMGSTVAGLGSGAARAAKYQLFGEDKRPSKNWKEAMATGMRASDEVIQKRNDNSPYRDQLAQAEDDARKYSKEYEDALRAGNTEAANEAKKKLEDARKRIFEATALVRGFRSMVRRADAWTAGTISVEDEQAMIRFGNNLDALKAKTREEAYKKDPTGAGELKRLYDEKKAEPIKEYEDGWDPHSANQEYQTRKLAYDRAMADPNNVELHAAKEELDRRRAALEAVKAKGLGEGDAEYDLAYGNLQTAVADLNAQFRNAGLTADIVRANGKIDLFNGIKVDMEEATRQRTLELEGLRLAHEAAADAWVQANAAGNDNIKNAVQSFLTENASYIERNKSTRIFVGYKKDSEGNQVPVHETLSDVIRDAFGNAAADRGVIEFDEGYGAQRSFVFEYPVPVVVSGRTYDKITYKYDERSALYVPYAVDHNGVETAVPSTVCPTYREKEFFDAIKENYVRGKIKRVSSKTAIAEGADRGKTAASYVTQTALAQKNRMIRQKEDAKK